MPISTCKLYATLQALDEPFHALASVVITQHNGSQEGWAPTCYKGTMAILVHGVP